MIESSYPRSHLYTKTSNYLSFLKLALTKSFLPHTNGEDRFSSTLCNHLNTNYVIPVSMARTGLYYCFKHLVSPGKRIILSPLTIPDVVNMIVAAGAVPVFADVQIETCNIDPSAAANAVDSTTGAILATHLHGLACDIVALTSISKKAGIPLIEDAAQAFGGRIGDRYLGTFGDVGVYSFGLYKHITSFFGGMIATNSSALAESISKEVGSLPSEDIKRLFGRVVFGLLTDIATHPIIFQFLTFWIFRYAELNNIIPLQRLLKVDLNPKLRKKIPKHYLRRMTHWQENTILSQLSKIEEHNQARAKAAQLYYDGLSDIENLELPKRGLDGSHLYTYFPIQVAQRDLLVKYCIRNSRDIFSSHYYNCASLECFRDYYRPCPNAEKVASSLVYLPTYPGYPTKEIERTISVMRKYFRKKAPAAVQLTSYQASLA